MRAPLLEREPAVGVIDAALTSLGEGHGTIILISGEAGIGKSRLLAEARDRARAKPVRVLGCRCQALEQDFSFGVALELFQEPWLEGEGRARGDAAGLAAPLFARGGEEPQAETPSQIFPLLHGLYWLTAELAAKTPLLISVDDAHWSDPPSLQFLNYLAGRLADLPVALMVAVRTGEADSERSDLLSELEEVEGAQAMRPQPLSPIGVEQLVKESDLQASPAFCAACAKASGGNPLLLRELLAELRAQGISPTDSAAERVGGIAPEGIRKPTLLRLARLGEPAGATAKAIAVLQDDAKVHHVSELAGLEVDAVARAGQELAAVGILAGGDWLEFTHPLLETAVYSAIPAVVRKRMHRVAAGRLADERARAEQVAAHLLAASRQSDPWTVEILRKAAAEALSRGSPESAVRYLTRALDEPAGAATVEVTLELGRALTPTGSADAVPRLERALELADNPVDRARTLQALARSLYIQGRVPDAADAFKAAANEAAGHDRELELQCQAEFLPVGLIVEAHRVSALELVESAVARVGEGPLTAAERAILGAGGLVATIGGEPHREAIVLAQRALDDGRLLSEEGADGTTLYSVTGTLSVCGELAASERVLTEAIEMAQRDGSMMGFATASYCRAHPLWWRGALIEGIADVRAAIETGWEQYLPIAYAMLVAMFTERDALDQARAAADELDQERWGEEPMYGWYLLMRGQLELVENDPASALADAERSAGLWKMANPGFYAEWRSLASAALVRLGERERAIDLAVEELELVRPFGAPRSLGVALRTLGLAQGGKQGIASLRQAVSHLEASEARLEHCRAVVDLGALLRRAGQRSEARDILRQGIDIAQRLGLIALERRANEELKLAGGKPRSRYLSGVESLTPGELRVARMAAEGMTNREIAQALFVTIKTVQYHLGNTYRKLEISSRGDLPAVLGESA